MSQISQFFKSKTIEISFFKFATFSVQTPFLLYALHRFLFRFTNGLWNDLLSKYISFVSPKYKNINENPSLLGAMSEAEIKSIAQDLEQNGFCIFKQRLSQETINSLRDFSLKTPVRYLLPVDSYAEGINYSKNEHLLDEVQGKSVRYQFDANHLVKNPLIQEFIFDPNILKIAQEYLKSKPILDFVDMWWSFPKKEKEKFASSAAQKFHFDMDRIKFLKFFFYLTDVDTNTGPHCYVRSSHKTLPALFRKRGRFEDKDISQIYNPKDVVEICGTQGTIMAVDTRGLHKGKVLESGSRLLFQLEFSNSLFGKSYEKTALEDVSSQKVDFIKEHYQTFINFF
jgi:hypothetical protein